MCRAVGPDVNVTTTTSTTTVTTQPVPTTTIAPATTVVRVTTTAPGVHPATGAESNLIAGMVALALGVVLLRRLRADR